VGPVSGVGKMNARLLYLGVRLLDEELVEDLDA
jgi:hypothetical protein